jgi:hypothetical protein
VIVDGLRGTDDEEDGPSGATVIILFLHSEGTRAMHFPLCCFVP